MKWIVKFLSFFFILLLFLLDSPNRVEADDDTKPKKMIVHPKDQSSMILVSEGEFLMGLSSKGIERFLSDSIDFEIHKDETPQHTVLLDAYYIDQYEVTVKQYAQFLKEIRNKELNPCCHLEEPSRKNHIPNKWKSQLLEPNMPVVDVDWYDAYAYAKWAEKRLPTEAEWEKAARGPQGKTYPWGEDYPTAKHTNFFLNSGCFVQGGSYPKGVSVYGIHDLAGNVW
ncbi:MAG: formylglycine-generating enzyme family protein, partial [Planctomycetota bacterium]